MTTTTAQTGSFPSPYEIATPEGCEGWEEMYPYYALFDDGAATSRREPLLVLELDALPDSRIRRST